MHLHFDKVADFITVEALYSRTSHQLNLEAFLIVHILCKYLALYRSVLFFSYLVNVVFQLLYYFDFFKVFLKLFEFEISDKIFWMFHLDFCLPAKVDKAELVQHFQRNQILSHLP